MANNFIFKVSIEFVTILFLSYVLVLWPDGMWDLSCLTRDPVHWIQIFPILEGEIPTTGPPGKSDPLIFISAFSPSHRNFTTLILPDVKLQWFVSFAPSCLDPFLNSASVYISWFAWKVMNQASEMRCLSFDDSFVLSILYMRMFPEFPDSLFIH